MIPLAVRSSAGRRPGVIAVTLPSRRRREMLTASVTSLRETAARPDLLEFLVAYDPDDEETPVTARDLDLDVAWQAPERYGYYGLANYYAALVDRVTGEWCLPTWGDDALMQTPGWDDIIRAQPPCSIVFPEDNYPGWVCFPVVHMDVFSVLRRFCPLPATDSWYEFVGRDAGIAVRPQPGIYVLQDRFDLTGSNDDETYREGRSGFRTADFYAEPYATWRAEDAMVLQLYASALGSR
jgi:hypothetical protein